MELSERFSIDDNAVVTCNDCGLDMEERAALGGELVVVCPACDWMVVLVDTAEGYAMDRAIPPALPFTATAGESR
jgi:hypothetical protein